MNEEDTTPDTEETPDEPAWVRARTAYFQLQAAHGKKGEPTDIPTSKDVSEPGPDTLARTPALVRHINGSPTMRAKLDPPALETAVQTEQAFQENWAERSKKIASIAVAKEGDEASFASKSLDPMYAAWYKERMDSIGMDRLVYGGGRYTDEKYDRYRQRYQELSKTPANFFGEVLGMGEGLAEQVGTGFAVSTLTLGRVSPMQGAALRAGWDAAGSTYNRLADVRGADGLPLADNVKRGIALTVGAANTGLFLVGDKFGALGLSPLVKKFGIGKSVSAGVEEMVIRAANNPTLRARFAELATQGLKTGAFLKAYSLLNEIVEPAAQKAAQQFEPEGKVPEPDWSEVWINVKQEANPFTQHSAAEVGLGVLLGLPKFVRPGRASAENVKALDFRNNTLPKLQELSQSKVGESPEHLRDLVSDMQEHHDPGGPSESIEIAAQKLREFEKEHNITWPPGMEERIRRGEDHGGGVVVPTKDLAADVLHQEGSEKLGPFIRVGNVPTVAEEGEIGKAIGKVAEKNPIDVETEKVYNEFNTKFTAEGLTPEVASDAAELASSFIRAVSIDKARETNTEARPFEVYSQAGFEGRGKSEAQMLAWKEGLQKIESKQRKSERLAGTLEQKAEEALKPPQEKAQQVQELARKTFGELIMGYRTEDGKTYLDEADAKESGAAYTPIHIRPEELSGLTLDEGRIVGHGAPEGRERAPGKGVTGLPGLDIKGLTIRGKGVINMLLTGHADAGTVFHELGHYMHFFLEQVAPERLRAVNEWLGVKEGETPTREQYENFAKALEQYFIEGKAPTKELTQAFQNVSRYMRSAYGKFDTGYTLTPEARRTFDRFFALQEETEAAVGSLGPEVFESSILTPEELLQYRKLRDDYRTKALDNVSEKAGASDRAEARKNLATLREFARQELGKDASEQDVKDRAHELFTADNPGFTTEDDYVKSEGIRAAYVDAHDKVRDWELRTLAKKMGKSGEEARTRIQAIKNRVQDTLRTMTPKDVKPWTYYRNELRSIEEMKKALGKNDPEGAWEASTQAIAAGEMFKSTDKLKDSTDKWVDLMKRFSSDDSLRAKVNRGGKEWKPLLDWTLQSLGFDVPDPVEPHQVEAAIKSLRERGQPFFIPEGFDNGWQGVGWRNLDSDHLFSAFQAAKEVVHRSQLEGKLIKAAAKEDLAERSAALADHIRAGALKKSFVELSPAQQREFHPIKKLQGWFWSGIGTQMKAEGIASIIDQHNPTGEFKKSIVQPMFDAATRAEKSSIVENEAFKNRLIDTHGENLKTFQERRWSDVQPVEGAPAVKLVDFFNVLGIMGDRHWRDIFLREEQRINPKAKWSYENVINTANQLLAEGRIKPWEIKEMMNGIRDQLDSHYEKMADIHERETGIRPEKVEASPFTLDSPEGPVTFKGGYWAANYDYSRAPEDWKQANPGWKNMDPTQTQFHWTPGEDTSFTQERTTTGLPVPLDWKINGVLNHLDAIIRYNEMHEDAVNTTKLLKSPEVASVIKEKYNWAQRPLDSWLKDLQTHGAVYEPYGAGMLNRAARFGQRLGNTYLLAFKLGSSVHQLSGIISSLDLVHEPVAALKAAIHVLGNWPSEFKRISDASNEVKNLSHVYDAAFPSHVMDEILAQNNPSGFKHLTEDYKAGFKQFGLAAFKINARIAQTFAYAMNEASRTAELIKEGRLEPGSPEFNKEVADYADAAVRRSHTGGGTKDMASFFRNPGFYTFFTRVAGYRNQLFNHLVEMGYDARRGDVGNVIQSSITNFLVPAVWTAFVARAYAGVKDEGDVVKQTLAAVARQVLGTAPIVGDEFQYLVNVMMGKVDPSVHLYGTNPIHSPFLDSMHKTYKDVVNFKHIKQEHQWGKLFHDSMDTAGFIPYSPTKGIDNGIRFADSVIKNKLWQDPAELAAETFSPHIGKPGTEKRK